MTMMSGALYDALIDAGSSDAKARRAAEEVSAIRTEFAKISGRFDVLEAKSASSNGWPGSISR